MSSLNETLGAVGSTASSAADSIGGASGSLNQAADVLDDSAQKLVALHGKLTAALESDDMNQVRSILSGDVSDLANFISNPVIVDRNPIYAIENNGSAMAPFYTTLAIWIGGVVLAALVKTDASEKAIEETGCSHTQVYLGRLALFAGVGLLQSALICAGDLYFLGVQCANPALFFLVGWLASFVFVNIIYALTASFGDVGKAIAVVLMVIQVAGSSRRSIRSCRSSTARTPCEPRCSVFTATTTGAAWASSRASLSRRCCSVSCFVVRSSA